VLVFLDFSASLTFPTGGSGYRHQSDHPLYGILTGRRHHASERGSEVSLSSGLRITKVSRIDRFIVSQVCRIAKDSARESDTVNRGTLCVYGMLWHLFDLAGVWDPADYEV